MVTVQEAPIVNPPETTGTSANEEPKSSVADISQRANGAAALNDCVNDSQKESTGIEDRKSLILNRLKELEQETGEPEKRDVLRRRKKQLKDIDIFIKENAKSSEEVIEFLQQKLLAQFKEQTKLEAELIPLRLKVDRATKAKDEAQAEVLAKSSLNLKLQELARKLQQQNREMKEEDVMQRKLMIENFQRTLNDLKSRVDETNVKREESLNEKKAHLDMQNIMEQHYKAKVREMEVRLELADAKLRQAELTAMEHLHTAQIEAANFKEASRLLNDMGDKYRQFETTMKETSEAFKKTTEDSGKQERLIAKMDSLLAVRESDKQNLKRDLTRANAKIIQLASEAQTLRNQQAEEGSELERVRGQNSLLQKLARRLQQEVKALQSASADGAPAPGESAKTDSSNTCPTSEPAHELPGPEADVSESAAE